MAEVNYRRDLEAIFADDRKDQGEAFVRLVEATQIPVGWAAEVWDRLLAGLTDPDNRIRAISAQLLCNLAKSDQDGMIGRDFAALLNVTRDVKFVTARHCLQNLWKVGVVGEAQRALLVSGLRSRFAEAATEKNGTLIRYDIMVVLATVWREVADESVRTVALEWVEEEADPKYRKKYLGAWK